MSSASTQALESLKKEIEGGNKNLQRKNNERELRATQQALEEAIKENKS